MATGFGFGRVSLIVLCWQLALFLTNTISWVDRPNRPISLRQLFFFGRTLTESRLLSSANYVRMELPTRLESMHIPLGTYF